MSVLCVHVTDLNSFMDTSQVKKIVSTKTMLMLIVCNFLFFFWSPLLLVFIVSPVATFDTQQLCTCSS